MEKIILGAQILIVSCLGFVGVVLATEWWLKRKIRRAQKTD